MLRGINDIEVIKTLVPGKKYRVYGEDCCLSFDLIGTFIKHEEELYGYKDTLTWDFGTTEGGEIEEIDDKAEV